MKQEVLKAVFKSFWFGMRCPVGEIKSKVTMEENMRSRRNSEKNITEQIHRKTLKVADIRQAMHSGLQNSLREEELCNPRSTVSVFSKSILF